MNLRLFRRSESQCDKPASDVSTGRKAVKYGGLTALVGAAAVAVLVPTVQRWEGVEHVPYRDIVGIWTVCYGDTNNVVPGRRETQEQCEARLERQLIAHAKPVLECVPKLTRYPNATAAAVSLAYNIGPTAFCRSTVARRFNAGDIRGGCDALMMWNKARVRGKLVVVRGLTNRRNAERAICLKDA